MKKKKIFLKVVLGIILSLILIVIANFSPAWNLKTSNMHKLEGKWINVFYETEEDAALDVFTLADAEAEKLAAQLGFHEKQDVNIYIYDSQSTMQRKKYGLVGPLLGLDWYIGDNIKTNVILTSPANPGRVHNYNNNKYAALHEMVHAYVSVLNPKVQLWLTEGTALYLSNGEPFYKRQLENMKIPSYSETQTKNPITFSNIGGYKLAHTYIEYIDVTYGWGSVLKIIQTNDYQETFGKTQESIYLEWVDYIEHYEQ